MTVKKPDHGTVSAITSRMNKQVFNFNSAKSLQLFISSGDWEVVNNALQR